MLALFGRKKLTDDKVANLFVHTTIDAVEKGWPEVAGFVIDSPEFVQRPNVCTEDYGKFLMIVVAANFNYIPKNFDEGHDKEIINGAVAKFAEIFGLSSEEFKKKVSDYRSFLSRVNQPSKNTLYSMSRGIFHKYNLNDFQEDYFKSMKVPNPIFLKNMNEIMENFLWDWDAFKDKYKV